VAALLQEPADPGRVGPRLHGDAHGPLGGEAPPEGLGGGAQPAFLDYLAVLRVDEAQGKEYVSPRSNPAVVFGCSLLTSIKDRSFFHSGP